MHQHNTMHYLNRAAICPNRTFIYPDTFLFKIEVAPQLYQQPKIPPQNDKIHAPTPPK